MFGLIAGGSMMTFIMYFYLTEKADIRKQKNNIIRFISAMKKIAKTGDTQRVKKSVKKFTIKCSKFYAESFFLTKFKSLEEVGQMLQVEDNKKNMYSKRQFEEDNSMNMFTELPVFDFIKEEELQKKIEKNLLQTIGVN